MTLANLRDAVDAKLANLWPRIVNRQDAYFLAHGHYWQGMFTHTIPPNTTNQDNVEVEVAPDNLNARPTDETEGWQEVSNFPATLAYRLRMDIWEAEVKGYTGTIQVRHNGNHYQRSKSVPDDRFTQAWFRLSGPSQSGL